MVKVLISDKLSPAAIAIFKERGVEVDHSTLNRWVLKYVPVLEKAFLARKRPVGGSWRLDETYVRVKGAWKYLYRAVDKVGATVDFLLTARRDRKAGLRFLRKAIGRHGVPYVDGPILRRSRSTRAAPTRRRSSATMPTMTRLSRSARSSISTTSLNRIIERSSEGSEQCWGSKRSGQRR